MSANDSCDLLLYSNRRHQRRQDRQDHSIGQYAGYPTAVYRHYDYYAAYLRAYADAAKDDEKFNSFQDKHLYGVKSHQAFLDLVGQDRLTAIKADPRTGYAVNMKRG